MPMNVHDYAEEKKISIRQILDFTVLTNPLGPSSKARAAMRTALKTAGLPPDGKARYLRKYLARTAGVKPENIVFGHGSSLLLEMLLATLKPQRVLVPGPVPGHYAQTLGRHGASIVRVPLSEEDGFAVDTDRLVSMANDADVLLTPNPHWLTGAVIPNDGIRTTADKLAGSGKLLVLDEGLTDFAGSGFPPPEAILSQNILILRSFSYFHALAGLRLGYAIGNETVLASLFGPIDPGPVSNVAAAGALASLKDKEFKKRSMEYLKTEKEYLMPRLGRIEGAFVFDTPCNFLIMRMEKSGPDAIQAMGDRHFLVETLEVESDATLIRVPVRRHRENARFAKTLGWVMRDKTRKR